MRHFRRICIAFFFIAFAFTALLNYTVLCKGSSMAGYYRVEAKRLADQIEETGSTDISSFTRLTGVFSGDDIYTSDNPYVIIKARGRLYRVEYEAVPEKLRYLITADSIILILMLMAAALMIYISRHILRPFSNLSDVPKELAKGNLAVVLPEEKSRFFGKFTWGVNLLRENIENSRRKEITFQKDRKLLMLSLSHDIKTPLSAIKLNAKALARGLYKDEEKRREAAESINARADEIEHFVSEITKASSEDFMNFEVTMDEVFLSDIVKKIANRYTQQLSITGTQFEIGQYNNCLLSCDCDRLAECLQNLIENAIKYGDGQRISMSFENVDGCELITVSNTGCTLEPDEITQIFSSFYRGSNTENIRGNGLGLFICRKLMALMNGEVYADIHDGCFFITLVVRMA